MPPAKDIKNEHRAVLYFLTGNIPQEAIKLRRDATIFGREKGDIIIDDHEISSTHFQIQNINGTYHIFDMNSTNGTYLNKERVVRAKLTPEDIVTVGHTSFRFAIEEEAQVRHISTIFNVSQLKKDSGDNRISVVDSLIENELRVAASHGISIHVTYKNGTSEEIRVEQNVTYIGRASSFGHFDQDSEISRKHLKIKVNDMGEIFVEDQGSTNGSFINGSRVRGIHPVKPTDEIKVGFCLLRLKTLAG